MLTRLLKLIITVIALILLNFDRYSLCDGFIIQSLVRNDRQIPLRSSNIQPEFDKKSPEPSSIIDISPNYAMVFAILPAASTIFPMLLSHITDFTVAPIDRQGFILQLLLFKRVYLYSLALVALDWCSKRSLDMAELPLGSRMLSINQEMFSQLGNNSATFIEMEQSANAPLYESLNKIESSQQAAALPVLLFVSLAASFGFITIFSQLASSTSGPESSAFALSLRDGFTALTNGAVAFLFSKAELQRIKGLDTRLPIAAALLLASLSLAEPTGGNLWPLQNCVNVLIAVTASRAVTLPKLRYVLLALAGLAVYDVVSVVGTTQFTDNGQSIMEAVARAKAGLTSSAGSAAPTQGSGLAEMVATSAQTMWRPGLLQVVVGGRVSDVLGLADVIFPALLSGWALRFDHQSRQSAGTDDNGASPSYYSAALAGFAVGCILCELLQTGAGGQPALLYLVPSMVTAVLAVGVARGEVKAILEK